jgi:hypothetical protein
MQGIEHIPTEETRKLVRSLSAVGIRYVDIASKLEKDLEDGRIDANASIGQTLFQQAKNGNTAAAIFWLKTRAQWKETSSLEVTGADGSPLVVKWQE